MSSSGQAPNVSMDELLSSIKSMIEGESTGGGMSPDQNAGGPPAADGPLSSGGVGGAVDDGIMDLTQVVKSQDVPSQNVPPVSPVDPLAGGVEPPSAAPEQELFAGAKAEIASRGAQDTASQINDILGGMNADLGIPAGPFEGAPDAQAVPQDDLGAVAAAGDPLAPGAAPMQQPVQEVAGGISAQDPAAAFDMADPSDMGFDAVGQDPAGGVPDGALTRGLSGGPDGGLPDLGPQGQVAGSEIADVPQDMLNPAMQGQPPQAGGLPPAGQGGQGPEPMQGQGGVAPHGQNQLPPGQMPQSQMPQGQPPVGGMMPQRQMGVPGGAPLPLQGQPPVQHDPLRQESELAMGQALSQAEASLNANPALQNPGSPPAGFGRGLPPAGQVPQGQGQQGQFQQGQLPPGQWAQGQMAPAPQGYDLPVPAAGRAVVPAAQPMMMPVADPSVDQLPLEMRNNLEEIVKQLLKPLLREWLERNLPELLKGAIDDSGKIDPDRI